ncbi:MAG: protein kinase [Myxococcota bacterium]
MPHSGDVIAGRYRLERELARGGMGCVWAAADQKLQRRVAVKLMASARAEHAEDSSQRRELERRFAAEAMAVAKMQSPYIVQVFDFGREGDTPYIVMELLEGEDLRTRLHRHRRVSLDTAAVILVQAAKALSVAHAAGIVHRDLKPSNVFLVRTGGETSVKVLDFGVASRADDGVDPGANSGANADGKDVAAPVGRAMAGEPVIGTPHYMSPEQARGLPDVDHRSDLWSLAVIVYQALVGRLPFAATTTTDVIVQVCTVRPPLVRDLAPDLPPELDDFFARALAKEPGSRFATAREMALAFSRISPVNFTTLSMPDPAQIDAAIAAAKRTERGDGEDAEEPPTTVVAPASSIVAEHGLIDDGPGPDEDFLTTVHVPLALRSTPGAAAPLDPREGDDTRRRKGPPPPPRRLPKPNPPRRRRPESRFHGVVAQEETTAPKTPRPPRRRPPSTHADAGPSNLMSRPTLRPVGGGATPPGPGVAPGRAAGAERHGAKRHEAEGLGAKRHEAGGHCAKRPGAKRHGDALPDRATDLLDSVPPVTSSPALPSAARRGLAKTWVGGRIPPSSRRARDATPWLILGAVAAGVAFAIVGNVVVADQNPAAVASRARLGLVPPLVSLGYATADARPDGGTTALEAPTAAAVFGGAITPDTSSPPRRDGTSSPGPGASSQTRADGAPTSRGGAERSRETARSDTQRGVGGAAAPSPRPRRTPRPRPAADHPTTGHPTTDHPTKGRASTPRRPVGAPRGGGQTPDAPPSVPPPSPEATPDDDVFADRL